MSDDYEVGRGRPPRNTQFKKGRSGNPKGRPKGSRNFAKDVKDALEQPVRLTEGGRLKTVSTQNAAIMRLREKALKGDARALDRLLDLARTYNDEDVAEDAARLSLTDNEVLEAFKARLLRQAEVVQPDDCDDSSKESPEESAETADDSDDTPEEEDDDAWLY